MAGDQKAVPTAKLGTSQLEQQNDLQKLASLLFEVLN